MGFYSTQILPYLLDWSMSDDSLTQYRQDLLQDVQGDILEIGFGSGLNLAYYPDRVQKITAIDANSGIAKLAEKRIKASTITVDYRILNGESLPIADSAFDSVVSTWTLCSIRQVDRALQEIYRVLKPGGKFFFVEHGLSNDPNIQIWQNRLNPIQKVIADGCHLNRNIRQLVTQHFETIAVEEFPAEKMTKILGYLYKGVATKAA